MLLPGVPFLKGEEIQITNPEIQGFKWENEYCCNNGTSSVMTMIDRLHLLSLLPDCCSLLACTSIVQTMQHQNTAVIFLLLQEKSLHLTLLC